MMFGFQYYIQMIIQAVLLFSVIGFILSLIKNKKGGNNMLSMFGIKSQGSMILLKELRFNTDDNSKVRIKGEKVGILQWILSKIGLADISYCLSVKEDRIAIESGKSINILPLKELHDFSGGFKNNKMLLIAAILVGLFLGLTGLADLMDGRPVLLVIAILISGLLYYLFTKSGMLFLEFTSFNGMTYSLKMRSGSGTLQGGETVDFQTMIDIINNITELAKENSKYYSK